MFSDPDHHLDPHCNPHLAPLETSGQPRGFPQQDQLFLASFAIMVSSLPYPKRALFG